MFAPKKEKQDTLVFHIDNAYTSEDCHPFRVNAATGTRKSCHFVGA